MSLPPIEFANSASHPTSFSVTFVYEEDIGVVTRDGTRLAADVFHPSQAQPGPTVVVRTPYGRNTVASRSLQVDVLRLVDHGYSVVIQDVRGRGGSEGQFQPFLNEKHDGLDTLEWVADRPWCNGSVAMAGSSYLAFCQTAVAAEAPEHLKAWIPLFPPFDVASGWVRENGAFSLGFNLAWLMGAMAVTGNEDIDREAITAAMDRWLDVATLGAQQPLLADSVLGGVLEKWGDPDANIDVPRPTLAKVRAPALVVAGWFDVFQPESFDLYEGLSVTSSDHALVVGPWDHSFLPLSNRSGDRYFGRSAAIDLGALQLSWLDTHLKAEEGPPPRARYFITGANTWQSGSEWPPPHTYQTWYPGRGGSLSRETPAEARSDEVTLIADNPTPTLGGRVFPWEPILRPGSYDQRRIEQRSDVLTYTSSQLTTSCLVTGRIRCSIGVSSTSGCDVVITVADVHPDGSSWNIADGVARSFDPGNAVIDVRLGDTAHRFESGHRIRLTVAFASFPRIDIHPRGDGVRSVVLGEQTALHLPVAV